MLLTSEDIAKYSESLKANGKDMYRFPAAPVEYHTYSDLHAYTQGTRRYNTVSPYGKKMNEAIIETNKLIKEIDREIRDNKERVKKYNNSINGAKYQNELLNITTTLLNAKLSAIKTKADFTDKIDKSMKADYKLAMDIAKENGVNLNASSIASSSNDFISGLYNGGGLKANYNILNGTGMAPSVTDNLPGKYTANVNSIKPTLNHLSTKEEDNINDLPKPKEEIKENPITKEAEPEPTVTESVSTPVIPTIDDEGLNDFIFDDSRKEQSASAAYNNIKITSDPNFKEFFKFNSNEGIGYLVMCNTETNEIVEDYSSIPVELLYPWTIDNQNGIVSTYIRENYPILYTDDPIPDHIREAYNTAVSRESNDNLAVEATST